jgi:transglutaminase-like putative cysteine protease
MNKLFLPFLTGLAALGCEAAFISYLDSSLVLFPLLSFIFTGLAVFLSEWLPAKKRWIGAAFFPLLAAVLMILTFDETIISGKSLLIMMGQNLSQPYNLLISFPAPKGSPFWMLILLTFVNCAFFTASAYSKFGRAASLIIYVLVVLTGFYFNSPPPVFSAVLLAAWGLTLAAKKEGSGSPSRLTVMTALIAGLLAFFLIPPSSYSQPRLFSDIQSKIISLVDPYDPIFHAGHALSSIARGADGSQYLGQTDGIQFTGRYLASIRTPSLQSILYLRSWAGGLYEKNQWKNIPTSDYQSIEVLFKDNQGEWYDQGAWFMEYMAHDAALADTLNSYLDNSVEISSRRSPFSVTAVYDKTKYYYLPYDADFGAPFFVLDRSPEGSGDKTYLTERWNIPEGAVISMIQGPSLNDSYYNTYVSAEKIYRKFVYDHYCTVPDGVLGRLGQEISIPKAETMAEKRAWTASVQNFLRNNFTYTTEPGRTPRGQDFISYFLNDSRKGYCTAFASAGVMLLRAAGIPARYVVGLTVGPDEINNSAADADSMHSFDINDYHAHAWAEVYVDGLGWRPCEFTPGHEGSVNPFPVEETQKRNHETPSQKDEPQNHQIENEVSKKQTSEPQPNESKKVPPKASAPQKQPQNAPRAARPVSVNSSFILLLGAAILLILIISFLIWHRLRAVPMLLNGLSKNKRNLSDGISYLLRLTAWAGYPLHAKAEDALAGKGALNALFSILRKKIPRPSSYPADYAAWAREVSQDPKFSSFASLISLLEASRFSGRSLSNEEQARAAGLIQSMRQNCIEPLSLRDKISFLLGWKL